MRTNSRWTAGLATIGLVAGLSQIPATAGASVTAEPAGAAASSVSASDTWDPSADIPPGYYDDAEGKTGEELHGALHTIISSDVEQLTYDEVTDALKATDEDPANPDNVILLYTGRSQSEDSFGTGEDEWNREHVWAKSHGDFGTAVGPGTDIHHLRPTDVTVNSTRSNLDFDAGGDELDEAPGNFYDDDSWEPRDEVKGDVARMIMYMDVRYDGEDGFPDLVMNDEVDNGSNPNIGRSSVLLQWHEADPPDEREQARNDVIYDQYQNNRNPFIDHPEYASALWG